MGVNTKITGHDKFLKSAKINNTNPNTYNTRELNSEDINGSVMNMYWKGSFIIFSITPFLYK